MPILYNLIDNKELKKNMLNETEIRITLSFYKYFYINNPKKFRDDLYIGLRKFNVFGRIYVSYEGINAQISIPKINYENFILYIYDFDRSLNNIFINKALDSNGKSFWVLRIKVRDRIVADGINDKSFNHKNVGSYIKAIDVNSILHNKNTIFVDMRNHYEYEVGHFENALNIPSDTFRNQLLLSIDILQEYKNKKIVMYCTGGIRCEKATAWLIHNGFKKVYHIEGGIIEYINCMRKNGLPIYFKGKNFVFDQRMGERISNDILSHCHQCGVSCDTHVNCINDGCHLLFIQCFNCLKKYESCCSRLCQEEIKLPINEQHIRRIIRGNNSKIFNKSRGLLNATFPYFLSKK